MQQKKWQKISSLLLLITILLAAACSFSVSASGKASSVILGGIPFGVRFDLEGVAVVGFCDIESNGKSVNPAKSAGLRIGDVITGVDGVPIDEAQELTAEIHKTAGKPTSLQIKRAGKSFELSLRASRSDADGRYKAGIWVKDSGAGIGTITYITRDGHFAGLGHGICNHDGTELVQMKTGRITGVTISGIVKGKEGKPGELKGYFTQGRSGALLNNTDCGVFGIITNTSEISRPTIELGDRKSVHSGAVTVICTLDDNTVGEYTAELSDIDYEASGNKCFTIKITDPKLLSRTGGIVQGMSGSPIIQNGKLVGAVTHVLINDPTTGYGIFIENMLNAAQMPMSKAS